MENLIISIYDQISAYLGLVKMLSNGSLPGLIELAARLLRNICQKSSKK
jgi:hypothetical protein